MERPVKLNASPAAPPFAFAWAALVYVVCTLVLAYPALGGAFLVSPVSDQYIGGFPVREFGASALRETGGFAQWNPYIFGGLPYVAAMHGDIFYPSFLLRLIIPVDAAMTWTFIIHLVLAGLFTFGFLRAWGVSFYPALLGGLAYMMGGPIASYVSPGHDGKLYVSALYPLALWLLIRGIHDARAWAWGVFAIVIGLGVLSPHPQLLQYMLLSCGAFGLFLAFADTGAGRLERRTAVRRLALAVLAIVIGFAMGAVQYNPVREYVDWSPRGEGGTSRGWEHATSYSFPPEELINTLVPQFSGILESYWGQNHIHLHSEYLSVVVLLIAGLAFGITGPARRRFLWFWVGTGIVGLLWSLGGFTPFYRLVYAIVPGAKFFRAPSTFFFVVAFAVAVLAALGLQRVIERGVSRAYLIGWASAGSLILVLGVTGGLVGIGTSLAPAQAYDRVVANAGQVTAGSIRTFVALGVGAAILTLLMRGRIGPRAAAIALAAVVAVDLWSIERLYWRFSPPASVIYSSDPAIDHIKAQRELGRVLALPLSRPEAYQDPFYFGDAFMVHDIRQVLGYHGNELARYQALVGKNEGYAPVSTPAIWRLLNVRYLYTNGAPELVPGLKHVVGPVRNAAGSTVHLYELPGENPFAWVAPVMVKAPDDAVLATVRDPRFDPLLAALVAPESEVAVVATLAQLPPPTGIDVAVRRYEPGRIELALDAPAPVGSALVVSENFYPGWRAEVDGREAPVARMDLALLGVPLPDGARNVALTFRSRPYEVGKAITLAAIAAALVMALGGALADRRRRA